MFDFHSFPWTNFHGINQNWILARMKELFIANEKNEDSISDLQKWMERLANYVKDYFDNLNVSQEVSDKLDELEASGDLAKLFGMRYFTGFNKAWKVFLTNQGMVQLSTRFTVTVNDAVQTNSGFWITPIYSRPVDMPVVNGAAVVGSAGRYGATIVNVEYNNGLVYYRIQSRENPNGNAVQVMFIISGDQDTVRTTPFYGASANGQQAVDIAKTYYQARVDGRRFAYGRNFTYTGRDALNDATGAGLLECDTLVLMAMLGIPYASSPYVDQSANQTYDFNTLVPGSQAWVLPWKNDPDFGGRITTTSAENWYLWHNSMVFSTRSLVRSGDLVIFRSNTADFYDGIIHIGIIEMVNDVPYVYHASQWVKPTESEAPVIRYDSLDDMIDGGFYGGDYYFARPNYNA